MARVFIDGFESGQEDLWTTENNATVISSAGLDMDGSYCIDLLTDGEFLQKSITATDEVYVAFLYRHINVSYEKTCITFIDASTVLGTLKVSPSTGIIKCYAGAYTLKVSGTSGLSVNTTYLIEVHFKLADTGGRWEVKIDSVLDIDYTGDTKPDASTTFDKVKIGGSNSYAYFDNFIMDDAAWIGDTNIQAIVPTAGGNSTGWTPSVGSNFACVDEIPASDTDYVSINANDVSDTYTTGDLSGSIDNIKCVQVQARARLEGAPTPTNLKLVVRCGATDYLSGDKAVPVGEASLYNLWATDPSDSAVWTESDVNAMQIGVKSAA